MEFDNKTLVIIGIILIGIGALYVRYDELAIAVGSGLVGYLSKDAVTYINTQQDDESDELP